jgi:peptide deformylase
MRLTDLAARIVQHEIDHLDGVLFVDRMEEEVMMKVM